MSDLDVEPVEDVDEEGDAETGADADEGVDADGAEDSARSVTVDPVASDVPEFVLYGGKGGVGKTTMAAATALASANAGTRTLVVSTDPAHSLSDAFERPVPSTPGRIHDDVPLFGAEIDPEEAIQQGVVFGAGSPDAADPHADSTGDRGGEGDAAEFGAGAEGGEAPFGDVLGEDLQETLFGSTMPSADEAAAVQYLLQLLDDDRFDRVVVDTAPTGHTLRLLQLPELMDSMVGRVLSLRERLSGMMDGLKGLFGADTGDGRGVEDLRELSDRIERLRGTLRDPTKTEFRVVMVPEEMSVVESERLLERLAEFEIPAGTVVVNRVMEDLTDVVDDESFEDAFVRPNLDSCDFCQRRWAVQQDALAAAQDVFRDHEVRRVPLFADEVRGEGMLRIVGKCLE